MHESMKLIFGAVTVEVIFDWQKVARLAVREKVCAHARLLKRDCRSLPAIIVVHSCFLLINLAGSWLISDRSCTQGAVYSYREIDRSTYFIYFTYLRRATNKPSIPKG